MGIKMTKNKRESEDRGRELSTKIKKDISQLEGNEKLEYDKSLLKSRIRNIESDLQHITHNEIIEKKLEILKEQLDELNKELKKE